MRGRRKHDISDCKGNKVCIACGAQHKNENEFTKYCERNPKKREELREKGLPVG